MSAVTPSAQGPESLVTVDDQLRRRGLGWKAVPLLFIKAVRMALSPGALLIARAAAFEGALLVFPALVVVATILIGNNASAVVDALSNALGEILPRNVHGLLVRYLTVAPSNSTGLLIGMGVIALAFATDMMVTLMQGFAAAYGLPRTRSVWHERLVGFALVVLAVIPVVFGTSLLIFSSHLEESAKINMGDPWWLLLGFRLLQRLIVLLATTLLLAIFYHVAPHRSQRWRDVVPGALVAAILWLISAELFSFYVVNVAPYRSIYGSVSTVVVMLIWLYLVSIFVMLGCEFNVAREARLHGWMPPPAGPKIPVGENVKQAGV